MTAIDSSTADLTTSLTQPQHALDDPIGVIESIPAAEELTEDERTTPQITRRLTILFSLASGFTSANLAYSQPILPALATGLNVSQLQIGNIPALAQAGNAVGLLFVLPLADFFPRRKFTLTLICLTAVFW